MKGVGINGVDFVQVDVLVENELSDIFQQRIWFLRLIIQTKLYKEPKRSMSLESYTNLSNTPI